MSLPSSTCALIVGAGPTGLAAALSLIHHGFRDFVIVDAVTQGENGSRAIFLHAATLETLDTIGCGDELVSKGSKWTYVTQATRTTIIAQIPFARLKPYTRHPYGLIIPQVLTEQILGQKLASLGVSVHRPYRVVGMKPNSNDAKFADVTFEDGQVITAKYIIAADGAHSTIRAIAGINFTDPTSENNNAVLEHIAQADVTFDDENVDGSVTRGIMCPENFFLCAPLPSMLNEYHATTTGQTVKERIFRISVGVTGDVPRTPSKEYTQNLVDKYGPVELSSDPSVNPSGKSVHIKDIIWYSRFRTRSAVADSFFTRLRTGDSDQGAAILLVGDAAHIHSPAGGQGMNLGLRDAIFLGEVLTRHINAAETGSLSDVDTILTSFMAERRSLALEVIAFTKRILFVAGIKDENIAWWLPISKMALRNFLLLVLGNLWFVQTSAVWSLSGLGRR
ncbi:hypothetical protein SCLCIDRAFT_1221363 [Scleroderma citrinum Foug A]|uniref:FAD-binding domain-containing protein n=1 Tax=Scleroderma citrinum Foug A TaxID=1036808 RepID=A0A0C3DFS2_9AGAM|nr:hypothetical protein SCLCIDRAFT_1221363 [Scleroderma citrinum Foug A]